METFNQTEFNEAIKIKDFEKIKSIAEKYREVIDINKYNTLTYLFSKNEINYEIIEYLVENFRDCININQVDENGNTVIMRCLYHGHHEILEFLIKNFKDSININQVNNVGETPLINEVVNTPEDMDQERDSDYSDGLKIIINNFKDSIDNNQANEAVMYACSFGYINLVKYLIENFKDSININQINKYGNNALMLACDSDYPNLDLVKYLIENFGETIDINQVNKDGNTALMLACNFKYNKYKDSENESHMEIVKFIMENYSKTININQTNKKGESALNLADTYNSQDMLKFLMKNYGHLVNIDKENINKMSIIPTALTEHIKSEEYKKKEFESIDTIFVKIGDVVHCYKKDNSVKRDIKDKSQLLLNVDTGAGRYMKTDDEGIDVYRYHNRTDTILYS